MKKGSRKLKHCEHINFSPLVPNNPQSPICERGHSWRNECMFPNECPDYKPAWGITLEAVKEKYGL